MSQNLTVVEADAPAEEAVDATPFRVLLVDVDKTVVLALARGLVEESFDVTVANGPAEALKALSDTGPYGCVVSELRMPRMGGLQLMSHVRRHFPRAARIMLTSGATLPDAVYAINDELLFRFLLKPCTASAVAKAVHAAARHQAQLHAAQELLESGWRGSVASLLNTLALARPRASDRADRVASLVDRWFEQLESPDASIAGITSRLTQLGAVGISPAIFDRMDAGLALDDEEHEQLARMPLIAEELLRHIPRLEAIRALLLEIPKPPSVDQLTASAIRLAIELDMRMSRGVGPERALAEIGDVTAYPLSLLAIAKACIVGEPGALHIRELFLSDVREGMTFTEEVRSPHGLLLAAQGQMVTAGIVTRAREAWDDFAGSTRVRIALADSGKNDAGQAAEATE